jgi:hypothetical protein
MPTHQLPTHLVTYIGEEGEHRKEQVSPQRRSVLRDTGRLVADHTGPTYQKGHHDDR